MGSTVIKKDVSLLKITTIFFISSFSPKYRTAFWLYISWTSVTALSWQSKVNDQLNGVLPFS